MPIFKLIGYIIFLSLIMAFISMIYFHITNLIWLTEQTEFYDGYFYFFGFIFNVFLIGISGFLLYIPFSIHFHHRVSIQNPKAFFRTYLPIVCFYWFFIILIIFILIINDLDNKETIGFFMSFTMASYLTAMTTHYLLSNWIMDVMKNKKI